jgi:hypothetical protein
MITDPDDIIGQGAAPLSPRPLVVEEGKGVQGEGAMAEDAEWKVAGRHGVAAPERLAVGQVDGQKHGEQHCDLACSAAHGSTGHPGRSPSSLMLSTGGPRCPVGRG